MIFTLNVKRSDLKDYHNQEFLPVGVEHMSPEQLKQKVLLNAPPPPLHLLLGTTTYGEKSLAGLMAHPALRPKLL